MITLIERQYFDDLFNRCGYVFHFSASDFDEFIRDSIGIALCEEYSLSKGKSLNKFIKEGQSNKIIKLLDDLLEFYKVRSSAAIGSGVKGYSRATNAYFYYKCREIIDREKKKCFTFQRNIRDIETKFFK